MYSRTILTDLEVCNRIVKGKVAIKVKEEFVLFRIAPWCSLSGMSEGSEFILENFTLISGKVGYSDYIVASTLTERVQATVKLYQNTTENLVVKNLDGHKITNPFLELNTGDKIHLVSTSGIYIVVAVFKETTIITCGKWQTINPNNATKLIKNTEIKCFAGGINRVPKK